MADVEIQRENDRVRREAPQRESNSNPPLIVVDQNGGIQKIMAPAIEAMSMALADAGAAIEILAQSQGQMVEKLDANHAQSEKSRKAKVVVRKAADGSYVGERVED
jgi:hypothetical protein